MKLVGHASMRSADIAPHINLTKNVLELCLSVICKICHSNSLKYRPLLNSYEMHKRVVMRKWDACRVLFFKGTCKQFQGTAGEVKTQYGYVLNKINTLLLER